MRSSNQEIYLQQEIYGYNKAQIDGDKDIRGNLHCAFGVGIGGTVYFIISGSDYCSVNTSSKSPHIDCTGTGNASIMLISVITIL